MNSVPTELLNQSASRYGLDPLQYPARQDLIAGGAKKPAKAAKPAAKARSSPKKKMQKPARKSPKKTASKGRKSSPKRGKRDDNLVMLH